MADSIESGSILGLAWTLILEFPDRMWYNILYLKRLSKILTTYLIL